MFFHTTNNYYLSRALQRELTIDPQLASTLSMKPYLFITLAASIAPILFLAAYLILDRLDFRNRLRTHRSRLRRFAFECSTLSLLAHALSLSLSDVITESTDVYDAAESNSQARNAPCARCAARRSRTVRRALMLCISRRAPNR